MTKYYLVPCCVALSLCLVNCLAEEDDPRPEGVKNRLNKSDYHLLNPVPDDRLRPMSTDRPDQTESPYTVDAGHIQLEMDLVNVAISRDHGSRSEGWSLAPINLKLGLLNNLDAQMVIDTYNYTRHVASGRGAVEESSGFGDLTSRLKLNLWGNDGGRTAFALMPFIKWPLPASNLRNGRTEGGVIVPFAVSISGNLGFGAQTAMVSVADGEGGGARHIEYINSAALGYQLTDALGVYGELFAVTGTPADVGWIGQVDGGVTYAIGEDLQLDFGCNFGITHSAPDFVPFVGLSRRW